MGKSTVKVHIKQLYPHKPGSYYIYTDILIPQLYPTCHERDEGIKTATKSTSTSTDISAGPTVQIIVAHQSLTHETGTYPVPEH